MKSKFKLSLLFLSTMALASCDDDDDDELDIVSETFTVRIENVSTQNLINTPRANGTVPLSPGVYAVYNVDANNPMFVEGQAADEGIELIAEDGVITEKEMELQSLEDVLVGTFASPGGPDNGPALFAGESVSFSFEASPGDRLQLATMFVQSNDWFYAFGDNGLDLFDGLNAIEGDVTSELVLYDAGTEEDTAPGTGPNQKPAQDPQATDVGPADAVNEIRTAATRHPSFTIPAASSVIRVTISHQ